MSALRLGRLPDGTRDIRIIDDGATPLRHNRGIRGATFDNPVQVDRAVGESHYNGRHEKRQGAHSPKVRK
jgi:hypothetical protein